MTPDPRVCELVGGLLARPDDTYPARLMRCRQLCDRLGGHPALLLVRFCDRVDDLTTDERLELFSETFEVDPLRRLERAGEGDLPDLIDRLGRLPPDEARLLAAGTIFPSLDRILGALEGTRNPYEHLLKAIALILTAGSASAITSSARAT